LNPRPTDFFAFFGLRVRRSSLAELRAHITSFERVFIERYRAYGFILARIGKEWEIVSESWFCFIAKRKVFSIKTSERHMFKNYCIDWQRKMGKN
jgi:hypothetical protein